MVKALFIVSCIILGIIASLIGSSIDAKAYWGNLSAEITSIAISVLIAFLIISRFTRYQREKQWKRVRRMTYQAITAHLCDILNDLFACFPLYDFAIRARIMDGRNYPTVECVDAMTDLIAQLQKFSCSYDGEEHLSDLATKYYNEIRWDVDQMRNVITPRVIQSSDDQELIDALVEFDSVVRELYSAIKAHRQVADGRVFLAGDIAFPEIIRLIEKARTIYRIIARRWATEES